MLVLLDLKWPDPSALKIMMCLCTVGLCTMVHCGWILIWLQDLGSPLTLRKLKPINKGSFLPHCILDIWLYIYESGDSCIWILWSNGENCLIRDVKSDVQVKPSKVQRFFKECFEKIPTEELLILPEIVK